MTVGLTINGDTLALWVQDTGIGIPEADLPNLFNRFHRGRNAAAYAGSGLGLAIVHAIAAAHHGEVTAVNTQPGARFTLMLPYQPTPDPEQALLSRLFRRRASQAPV